MDRRAATDPEDRIEIDPGLYIGALERQLSELTIELARTRAALEAMTRTAIEAEGAYQMDEAGEPVGAGPLDPNNPIDYRHLSHTGGEQK
jgi:hypothetical protein